MRRCPCRRCNPPRRPLLALAFAYPLTEDDEVAMLVRRYVDEPLRWGGQHYNVDWLERELEETIGLTHARWETERLREAARPRRGWRKLIAA